MTYRELINNLTDEDLAEVIAELVTNCAVLILKRVCAYSGFDEKQCKKSLQAEYVEMLKRELK